MRNLLKKTIPFYVVILCILGLAFPLLAQENVEIPVTKFDVDGNKQQLRPLMKNGKPVFVIGSYGIPADCTAFDVKSAGWNAVLIGMNDRNLKQILKDCEKAGVGVILNVSDLVYTDKREELQAFIKEYRHYPAIFGYYTADEPENFYKVAEYNEAVKSRPALTLEEFIKESLSWVKGAVREVDPKRYTFMCIAWYSTYMDLYSLCDVNMPNEYPTRNTKEEFEGNNAEILLDACVSRSAAQAHGGLGYIYTPYSVDLNYNIENYRPPTIQEFRYSVYAPITGGAMGMISWAGYRCSRSYAEKVVFPVTRELRTLTPFLLGKWMDYKMKCEPAARTNTQLKEYNLPQVNGCLRRAADGKYLLLAVNNSITPVNAKFTINIKGLPRTCKDFFNGRTVSINKGVITSKMSAYGVCAYIFSTEK